MANGGELAEVYRIHVIDLDRAGCCQVNVTDASGREARGVEAKCLPMFARSVDTPTLGFADR